MSLRELLVCPVTREPLQQEGSALRTAGGRTYELRGGVPILLPDDEPLVVHETELMVREGYQDIVQFMIDSLPRDRIVLDVGSGNRDVDDPRIVRIDPCLSPHVDVVGDVHALPLPDESIDLVHASAVFEHLKQPFVAAQEIWRVLRPGGYVMADCNFVYPFHGYPAVFFNASAEGMRQLFAQFTELHLMVAPWQMPSFALEAVCNEYLRLFKPQTEEEDAFVQAMRELGRFPVRAFDQRFDQASAQRVAAGTTYLGVKQPSGGETLLPDSVLTAWHEKKELQERFQNPAALVDLDRDTLDNLFRWAASSNREEFPQIAEWLLGIVPYDKGSFADASD
ncbi:MAG: methyltransferase domain-containing protein [Planctomycetes bacterium]|nr:methyltransferase domain-containing protein [Planctomycetota bacterium]